jgi:hypothetical protein
MNEIVLRDLSKDIQELIAERAKKEEGDEAHAVIEILHDAVIERMVEHDMAIIRAGWKEDGVEEQREPGRRRICITVDV